MKTRALWLWLPWALFAALAGGWIIYWNALADGAERAVHEWIAAQNAQGAHASVGRIVRHGFPVLMRLEMQTLAYAPARGGWRAETERADLNIEMANPRHIILQAKAPIAAARENGATTLITADALIASWRADGRGALAMAGVEADNLTLDDPEKEGVLAARKLVANVRPDPRAAGQYQIAFEAQTVTLPRPARGFEAFGLDVPTLRAAIVLEHGQALLRAAPGDPMGPWREAGGKLRFEALALSWGPLEATGSGQGALDAARRLEGALELPIPRPAPIFSALANGPGVDENAQRALALLAAAYAISGEGVTLDVDARDGVLKLEGVAVRALPPVY